MIFNLAEAAQEFLSEIVTIGESNESVRYVQLRLRKKKMTKNMFKFLLKNDVSK